jgi:hypothetical protein
MPEMLKYVLAGGSGTEHLLRYRAANRTKETPWPLVRKRTIPNGDRHLSTKFNEGCHVVGAADPLRSLISVF